MNGIMVWAWMLWLSHSFKDEGNYGLGMDALVTACRLGAGEAYKLQHRPPAAGLPDPRQRQHQTASSECPT